MSEKPSRPGEFDLIGRYFAPLAADPAARGLLDDAAVLSPPAGCDLVLTKDALAADIHFFSTDDPQDVARKALRVNLSDLAAKGADPIGYLLAIALPGDWTEDWIAGFAAGLAEDQERFGWSLLGGDTIRAADKLTLSVTAIGAVPAGQAVSRDGARPGDILYVSGTLGDSALGLKLRAGEARAARWALAGHHTDHLVSRYLIPEPRLGLAEALRVCAHAAMDISDGLSGDLRHLLKASGVAGHVRLADLPLSPAVQAVLDADPDMIEAVLGGGDDYEVLAAIPPGAVADFEAMAKVAGISVMPIGQCQDGEAGDITFFDAEGEAVAIGGTAYRHF